MTQQQYAPVVETRPPETQQVAPVRVVEPRNALGITALILGIVGLMFGIMPFTGFVAFGLGVTGLILAIAARGRLKRRTATNRKTTIVGAIASAGAIALGIWGMVIVFTAVEDVGREFEELGEDLDTYSQCIEQAETPEEFEACG